MSRKISAIALIVLTIALILIPGVHAETPIPVVIVEDLPDIMVAGSSYDMVLAFNLEEKAFSFRAEIMVTCTDTESPLGLGEVTIGPVDLNGQPLTCIENTDVPGLFEIAKTSLTSESDALLITITVSTRIDLMPEEYDFDVKLWADAYVEPEPEPEPTPPRAPGAANKKPVADAGPDQTVYFDETVVFDGSGSYDPDGSIMIYEWDFGDGKKATGATVSHVYSDIGSYTVTLTVKDYRNAEASDTCIITVTEETKPTPPTPKPAEFIIFNLTIIPADVEPREEVTITFTVTNIGEETGTCTVNLSVEGEPMTVLVTLDGGESEEVEFKLSPEAEGTYQVVVDGLTGSFTVTSPPVPLKPAEFIISGFTVSPTEVPTGEAVTVSVTITNIGEVTGTHILEIMVDGDTPEGPPIETVLEGGASTTITINVIEEEPKEHTVKVDGLTEVFTVTAPPSFVWTPAYISGILILILIAGTTTYTLYRKGRLSLTKSTPGQ